MTNQYPRIELATPHGASRLGLTNWSTSTATISAPTSPSLSNTPPVSVDSASDTSANKVIIPCQRNQLMVWLLGRDTNNDEIRYHFSLVNSVRSATGTDLMWRYTPILTVDGLMSSSITGASGAPVIDTDYYCDTITASGIIGSTGIYDDQVLVPQIYSPGNDVSAGYIIFDPLPAEFFEIKGDIDGGSGTAGTAWNIEYAWI